MWSSVIPDDIKASAPSARSKHSATIVGDFVYILGGRNGNLPLKDFWKYDLITGKWHQLKPTGERLPCLQEHSAVAYKENIFVFGGEVSFSSSTETPLWVYDAKANSWRKVKTKKGVASPKGRRGHTALVHNGQMLIYGGYQDLKGSCSELWAFGFDSECWHLISVSPNKPTDHFPAPRHKHSAVIHEEAMWVYGGMSDLQERADLWKFEFYTKLWICIKTKLNPGPLHSHACCKLPLSMIIFGGERNGQSSNELWKFDFDSGLWEKITITGVKPQPRSESKAFVVPEILLNKGSTKSSNIEAKSIRIRSRTCNSADRHSSYIPNNKIAPAENTYIFEPTQINYTDGSLAQQYSEPSNNTRSSKSSFLQEITKLSQINLSARINNKCNYSGLSKKGNKSTDSTESLLKQYGNNPQQQQQQEIVIANNLMMVEADVSSSTATPSRGSMMVKSKSAFVIKKKYLNSSASSDEEDNSRAIINTRKKRVEFDKIVKKIPRDPISVPNFSVLTLPIKTPVLTPVEASKLVYLTDEETDIESKIIVTMQKNAIDDTTEDENEEEFESLPPLLSLKRGDSYSSHLGYADNPFYHHDDGKSQENVSSTSDYFSIETVNRLSSASNYSVKTTNTSLQEEILLKSNNKEIMVKEGIYGFCNPNYMGPSKSMLTEEEKHEFSKMLSSSSSDQIKKEPKNNVETLELINLDLIDGSEKNSNKVIYRNSSRPWNLPLRKNNQIRAQSAGRVINNSNEKNINKRENKSSDPFLPLYIYIIGGKEHGHVTLFQRPISIWRLKLF